MMHDELSMKNYVKPRRSTIGTVVGRILSDVEHIRKLPLVKPNEPC